MQLHDAHWAVASEVKSHPVDGDEALLLLEQRAETTLARLQSAWLPAFLEDEGARFVHLVVNEVPAEFERCLSSMGCGSRCFGRRRRICHSR